MTPTTPIDDPALDLRIQAISACRALGVRTVADLATVTGPALKSKGARTRDVDDLLALIVAIGGTFADRKPRGRPSTGRRVRVDVYLQAATVARIDAERGEATRSEHIAALLGER